MAIYNTITIAPSGSRGWGDTFTNVAAQVEYLYAPYEGSFLYANSGDFINPYIGENSNLNWSDYAVLEPSTEGEEDFGELYPFDQQKGRVILKFPRHEQNPQITPDLYYYPYNTSNGNVVNNNVAEHTSLPSVELKMTIQPIRFGGSTTNPVDSPDTVLDGTAVSSPVYVEMLGVSNAASNLPVKGSDYTEDGIINTEYLGPEIHTYKWEKILMNSGNSETSFPSYFSSGESLRSHPNSEDINWPLGTRDIYFDGTNDLFAAQAGQLYPYNGNYQYASDIVQIFPPQEYNVNLWNSELGYRWRSIISTRHLPTLNGAFFTSTGAGNNNDRLNTGHMFPTNGTTVLSPNNYWHLPLSGLLTTEYILKHCKPIYYYPLSGGTVYNNEGQVVQLIIVGTKNTADHGGTSVSPADQPPLEYYNPDGVNDGVNEDSINNWLKIAKVRVLAYYEESDTLYVQTIQTIRPGTAGETDYVLNQSISSEIGYFRVFLDYPIPTPTSPNTEGFESVCDYSIMVNTLTDDHIQERHFRGSYLAYAYTRDHRYTNYGGNAGDSDTILWDSPFLNQNGSTIYFNHNYNQWAAQNLVFKNDRIAAFPQTASPWFDDLINYEYCYAPTTLKYNPQKFGLKFNREEQQFELEIPHIPPSIIKGTYKVF